MRPLELRNESPQFAWPEETDAKFTLQKIIDTEQSAMRTRRIQRVRAHVIASCDTDDGIGDFNGGFIRGIFAVCPCRTANEDDWSAFCSLENVLSRGLFPKSSDFPSGILFNGCRFRRHDNDRCLCEIKCKGGS